MPFQGLRGVDFFAHINVLFSALFRVPVAIKKGLLLLIFSCCLLFKPYFKLASTDGAEVETRSATIVIVTTEEFMAIE